MSDQYSTDDRKGLINRDKLSDGKRILPRDDDNIYDKQPNKKKRNIVIGIAVGVLILIGIILAIVFSKKSSDDNNPPGPGPGPDPDPPVPPKPFVPSGYNPYSIDLSSLTHDVDQISGNIIYNETQSHSFVKNLQMKQDKQKIGINATQIPIGINNQVSKNVSFYFGQADYKVAFVNIQDQSQGQPWSIPSNAVPKGQGQRTMRLDMNNFQYSASPFYFNYSSTRGSFDTLISTFNQTLLVSQKYIQMDITLPSKRVFGFGERQREFQLSEGTWTMWSNGQQNPYDDGTGYLQTYGVHPFALVQCKEKTEFVGIFFRNSNAQSPILTYNDDNVTSTLSYITTGGALEIYFFTKGTAKQIISNYQRFIGYPQLPPFWSLGWHSSSKMLNSLNMVKTNVDQYTSKGFPIESVWLDSHYMKNFTHFTVDNVAFNGLLDYSQNVLHKNNMKLIPVVQAGLSYDDKGDEFVSQALTLNTLIMDLKNVILESQVESNSTVFLDFFNNQSQTVWGQGLTQLYNLLNFDGLWLDMNEPTTFCNGSYPLCNSNIKQEKQNLTGNVQEKLDHLKAKFLEYQQNLQDINTTWYTSVNYTNSSTYYLPFIPSNKWNLDNTTLSLNATNSNNNYTQYNTHSLFGHMQSQATYNFLSSVNSTLNKTFYDQRLFLQSRSTFAGSGQYVSHSLGQNQRTFDDMRLSISGIMNFNMFGIPLVGPNICGYFSSNSTVDESELCGRWIQLSTFYPFTRINGDNFTNGNLLEPYNLNETYKTMAQKSIQERFKYLTFLYTCLFQANQEGNTCFDPLLYHYPTLDNAFTDIESTFIVGDALKVSPVLQSMNSSDKQYSVFFPQGNWVSMKNLSDVIVVNDTNGQYVNLQAPDDTVNVHLRPGYIVPIQNNTINGQFVNTTSQLKNIPVQLIVNRDTNMHAKGVLMINNDNTISSIKNQKYEYYEFSLFSNSLNILNNNPQNAVYQGTDIQNIQIANASDLQNVTSACYIYENNRTVVQLDYQWSDNTLVLMANKSNLAQNIKIQGIKQIVYATDDQLSLCQLSANWTQKLPNYYSWNTTLDLSKSESSAILTSSVSFLKNITLTARVLKNDILNIYWTFSDYSQLERTPFEVPKEIITVDKTQLSDKNLSNFILQVNQTDKPFIQIVNQQNNSILNINNFVLTEYFNFINSDVIVSSGDNFKGIMGLAERVSNDLFLNTGVYSLWARDQPDPVETGKAPGNNMYGTHPFYMAKSTDSSWFGVFTNLANAQDWYVNNTASSGNVDLTSYATGGVADLYIMYGQDPNQVTVQYQSIVGTPVLTPQWALGWNQCKWGYTSVQDLKNVVNNYSANGIPLDTIWSDIDYLANYRDFHYDDENGFDDLPNYVPELHTQNMHWIPIIDAGIAQRKGYDGYDNGTTLNIFLKTYDNQTAFTGQVWPDDAVYPDFFNPEAVNYWQSFTNLLWSQKIPFDGLWLDMNEASNFCNGACYADQAAPNPVQLKLPYLPTGRDLETKSIALDSIHYGNVLELDAHSLFGTMQARATHQWFQSNGNRTMIIQRSAYAGLGKFASRWLGDNFSLNEYMGYSVTGIMMHNILGITLAGSDICGFIFDTNAELCARWHVVGSFYPFSRNHNNWGQIPQEPYVFTGIYQGTIRYVDIMKQAIFNKYQMIRYYYTQMGLISQNGGALYKPLFFEFPDDVNAYQNQTHNIMLGKALKLSVLSTTIGQNSSFFYFPQGTWCQVFNTTAHQDSCITSPAGGLTQNLSTLAYQFYVHLREGHIIPMQYASQLKVKTSTDLQQHPVDFHIHPSLNTTSNAYEAQGVYLNDDGLVLNTENNQNVYSLSYSHTDGKTLTLTPTLTKSATNYPKNFINMNDELGRVEIYNAESLKLTSDYIVTATFTNNSTAVEFANLAHYNASSLRLQFEVDSGKTVNLPELVSLVFSQK